MTIPLPTPDATTTRTRPFTLGSATLVIGEMRLRHLKPALRDLNYVIAHPVPHGQLPHPELVDAMLGVIACAAASANASMTREHVEAFFLDTDVSANDGLAAVAEAFTIAQELAMPAARAGDQPAGEAKSL